MGFEEFEFIRAFDVKFESQIAPSLNEYNFNISHLSLNEEGGGGGLLFDIDRCITHSLTAAHRINKHLGTLIIARIHMLHSDWTNKARTLNK